MQVKKWVKKIFSNNVLRAIIVLDILIFVSVVYFCISPRLVKVGTDTYCIKNNYLQTFAIDESVQIGFKIYYFDEFGKLKR